MTYSTPTILIVIISVLFYAGERIFPGRNLPASKGWYVRVVAMNAVQIIVTLLTSKVLKGILGGHYLFQISNWEMPIVEGLFGWFIGTFFFYWWHRIRHAMGFWVIFHQLHHSPSRIEALTSFYKHPIEIFADSILAGTVIYTLLGASFEAVYWFNLFATIGEYLYHSNLRTPKWIRYFIQTPELHSIHHQLDVHKFNFSDIPIWDRLFSTYKDAVEFAPSCGFPNENERKFVNILLFKNFYND